MDTKTLNIPPEVKREIEEFAAEVERLNRGKVDPEDFKRYRLQQGIYGQRQDDVQMVRTKLSTGRMSSDQLLCLADFADKYSNQSSTRNNQTRFSVSLCKNRGCPTGITRFSRLRSNNA